MCQRNTLSPILGTCNLGNTLGCNIAGSLKALWLINHGLTDYGSILQHILQINQTAVMHMLCKIIGIVEMYNSLLMGFYNILWQKEALGNILADFSCHIITLHTAYSWILVAVFLLYFLILAGKQCQNLVVGRIGLPYQSTFIAVGDIISGYRIRTLIHNQVLHQILNLFYG